MNTEIAIIGGGASGLAAAIEVRRLLPQAEVLVIERLDRCLLYTSPSPRD